MPRSTLAGVLLTLAAAAFLVSLQPVRSSWWSSADPDGAYVGNSVNILLGNHTNYLDHPGLPTQDALALSFGARYLVERATGRAEGREEFANDVLLDLDAARPIYRGWALFLFFGSALLVFALVSRLLGHWSWGLAGAVLFVSAPSLAAISFLLRPDNALAALCLLVGYLAATGWERRSAARYTAAALLLGLAMTVKLSAVGMVVPLLLVVAWRPPETGWFRETTSTLARLARRYALWLVPAAVAWLALCWVFNRERTPILQTDDQRSLLVT
ncbi:MAG TPA: glycosyltransferase family 39 protein, partial [Gaiellaceae bacterium]|nr:glycosyltransferase family 39 protein [Gaiellaceae bacterium]